MDPTWIPIQTLSTLVYIKQKLAQHTIHKSSTKPHYNMNPKPCKQSLKLLKKHTKRTPLQNYSHGVYC